jgi:cohesin loading factor subunit SCC2
MSQHRFVLAHLSIWRCSNILQDDVNYMRYMAENFSAFDYKTQEEVLTVIKYLTSVLSTTGMQLLEIISPSHLLTHLHEPMQSQPSQQSQPEPAVAAPSEPSAVGGRYILTRHFV